jgi:hypothetical protein
MAHVATYSEYINKVVPADLSFNSEQYAGIFRFRFWQNGQWVMLTRKLLNIRFIKQKLIVLNF